MTSVGDVCEWLRRLAPLELSEEWDNTGLLLGDPSADVRRVQTCLTLTPETVDEAIGQRAELVVSHHPLPFQPLRQITTDTVPGGLVWRLANHRIAVYSPHTAWDSAQRGINAQLAELLGLREVAPLIPHPTEIIPGEGASSVYQPGELGAGRIGNLDRPQRVNEVLGRLSQNIPGIRPRGVGCDRQVHRVAVACGSGGSLLPITLERGCDLFLTGEASLHTCLEARAANIAMLLIGHHASERFSLERLADWLQRDYSQLSVWAAQSEIDPVRALTT